MARDNKADSGVAFVACMFIGMGIGWVYDQMVPGIIIGMGVGFLLMTYLRMRYPRQTK